VCAAAQNDQSTFRGAAQLRLKILYQGLFGTSSVLVIIKNHQ